ncbi:MAG: nucleotidyl transferase AbiEii/AbiGii toxin family protein [Acidimicrobiales bacterium]
MGRAGAAGGGSARVVQLGRSAPVYLALLSALQERVARVLLSLPETSGFVLAGGAALVLRGDVDRTTRDLDFFTTSIDDVGRVLAAFEAALRQAGLHVDRTRTGPAFVRLAVTDGEDRTEVD